MQGRTRSKSAMYPHSTAYLRDEYVADTQGFKCGYACVRNPLNLANPPESSQDRFERTVYTYALCKYVYTNQRNWLERIRSRSAWTTCCWADTCGLQHSMCMLCANTALRVVFQSTERRTDIRTYLADELYNLRQVFFFLQNLTHLNQQQHTQHTALSTGPSTKSAILSGNRWKCR